MKNKKDNYLTAEVTLLYPLAESTKSSRWVVYLPSGAVYSVHSDTNVFAGKKFGDKVKVNPSYLLNLTSAQHKRALNKGYSFVLLTCVEFNRGSSEAVFSDEGGKIWRLPVDYLQNPMPWKRYLYWDVACPKLRH